MTVSSYTLNYRFPKITFDTRGWHLDYWSTLDSIDGLLASAGIAVPFVVATGSANVIVLTFVPPITYTLGQQISFITSAANTGPVTVNANGLGAKALKSAGGAALGSGQLTSGMYVRAIYNGTDFTVIAPAYTANITPFVSSGPSGAIADPVADDFYVESNIDVGMSFLTPAGYAQRIYFGRPLAPSAGGIKYDHGDDSLTLRLNSADVIKISKTGVVDLGATGYTTGLGLPCFSAYHVYAAANLPASNADFLFNVETLDNANNYDNTTGVFTAPRAGLYTFDVEMHGTNPSNVGHKTGFYKNGVLVGEPINVFFTNAAPEQGAAGSVNILLALNDTVSIRSIFTGSISLWGGTFSGRLVG